MNGFSEKCIKLMKEKNINLTCNLQKRKKDMSYLD